MAPVIMTQQISVMFFQIIRSTEFFTLKRYAHTENSPEKQVHGLSIMINIYPMATELNFKMY